MKKSIGDNMIPKGWSFEQGLELTKKAGYDGIELWLGDVPWFQMKTTDAEIRELRRKVENAGLVVSNVSTGLHWETPLSARDPRKRELAERIVEREIEAAQILGCDAVLVVVGLVTEEVPYNEVYLRSQRQDRLRKLQFRTTVFADAARVRYFPRRREQPFRRHSSRRRQYS